MSIVIYELLKLIRGTRAVQMAIGIASIVVLFYFSRYFQLETLNWLIRNIVGYVVFAAIVLLQADIRRALVHLGRAPNLPAARSQDQRRRHGRGAGGGDRQPGVEEDRRHHRDRAVDRPA